MSELPKGWTAAKIRDAVQDYETVDPKKTPGKSFLYVDIGAIDNSVQKITEPKEFLGKDAPSRARRVIAANDVLFSTVRTYLKNVAQVPESLDGQLTSTGISVLRANASTDPGYLFRWVCSSDFIAEISEAQDGTMYPAVRDEDVLNGPIALPPLSEQRRIVRKLSTLSARTTTARTHLSAIAKLVERYKRGIYDHHFANAGELIALGTLAEVGTGATPKKGTARYYENGTVPWITSGAVNTKLVTEPSSYITKAALKDTNCKLFPAGSLIMAMYGEGKTRGQVARLGIEAATNQALAVIHKIDTDKVDSDYLYRFLDSIYLEIRQLAEGGVQPNLSLGKVRSFELPLPSLDTQRDIVRQIETSFGRIDRLYDEKKKR